MKVNAIMVRLISVLFMAGLAALLSGASLFATSKISSFSAMSDSLDVLTDSLLIKQESQMSKGDSIVKTALQYLGVRYVYGGASPNAFDCSGFTMYIMKQFGYNLPHTATGQWLSGQGTKVSYAEMMPGDLVFFCDPSRSLGKACSHAGIYVGNGQFIHASSSKSGVIYSDLSSGYYHNYYVGAIRLA